MWHRSVIWVGSQGRRPVAEGRNNNERKLDEDKTIKLVKQPQELKARPTLASFPRQKFLGLVKECTNS